jgi:hypothetical protein
LVIPVLGALVGWLFGRVALLGYLLGLLVMAVYVGYLLLFFEGSNSN